jgi:hypothetical protein
MCVNCKAVRVGSGVPRNRMWMWPAVCSFHFMCWSYQNRSRHWANDCSEIQTQLPNQSLCNRTSTVTAATSISFGFQVEGGTTWARFPFIWHICHFSFGWFASTEQHFMELTGPLFRAVVATIRLHSAASHPFLFRSILMWSSPLPLGLYIGFFPSGFRTKTLHTFFVFSIHITWTAYFIPLDLIVWSP